MTVNPKELCISAALGAVFGILGYYFTRQIYGKM